MKNLRCRPGDLAVILSHPRIPFSERGRICTVLEATSHKWRHQDNSDPRAWADWIIDLTDGSVAAAPDMALKPLRGNPDEQAEREREVVA